MEHSRRAVNGILLVRKLFVAFFLLPSANIYMQPPPAHPPAQIMLANLGFTELNPH